MFDRVPTLALVWRRPQRLGESFGEVGEGGHTWVGLYQGPRRDPVRLGGHVKSRRVELMVIVPLLVVVILASACGGASQAPSDEQASDGRVLLEERCTECHSIERATGQEKTRAEWEETVSRMIDKGAELNEEETTLLIDFLAENYGP